ncbi:MAG: hypothetical protein ABIP38_03540 [Steroidobacteraceae bacterium]
MNTILPLQKYDAADQRGAGEFVSTRAERLAVLDFERAEQRRQRQEEQRLESNTPEVRVRAWERLHGLTLPAGPSHPILANICAATGLARAEVLEVQNLRAARRAARVEADSLS